MRYLLFLLVFLVTVLGHSQPTFTPPILGIIPSEQHFGEPILHQIVVMDEGSVNTVRVKAMKGFEVVMDTVVVITYDKPFKFQLTEGLVTWSIIGKDDSGLKKQPKLFDLNYQVYIRNDIKSFYVRPYGTLYLQIYSQPNP